MKVIPKILFFLLVFGVFASFVSTPVHAGLVPCGTSDSVIGGYLQGECNFCDLQSLAMNILNFLVLATAIVAALLFLNAGVLYVMSSANPGNIAKAHGIFRNALMGMIIVFASWLVINQVMIILYDGSPLSKLGDWDTILHGCKNVTPPPSALPTTSATFPSGVKSAGPGYTSDDMVTTPSGKLVLSDAALAKGLENANKNCIAGGETCTEYIIAQAIAQGVDPNYALALAAVESGGCKDPASCTSPAGAVGVIQLMPDTARGLCGPECAGLSDAEMAVLLTEPTNNIAWGVAYMKESSEYVGAQMEKYPERFDEDRKTDYMAAYYNGGPTALEASADCGSSMTKYECTINPGGYVETQNYVEKMNTYVSSVDRGTEIASKT